ncbi:PilN domain-containing protein [Elusimicrobiota bacterium]
MIKINLLPEEFERREKQQKKIAMAIAAVALVILSVIGSYFSKVAKLAKANKNISKVEQELKKLKPVVVKVNDIRNKKSQLTKKVGVIKELMGSRLLYPIFMEDVAGIMPEGVWTNSIQTSISGNELAVSMNFSAMDNYAVANMINALEESEVFDRVVFTGIDSTVFEGNTIRSLVLSFVYAPRNIFQKEKGVPGKNKKRKKKKRK